MSRFLFTAFLAVGLCAVSFSAPAARAHSKKASEAIHASIVDQSGKTIGHVVARQEKNGVLFKVWVHGLKAGEHGVHIHAIGKCDTPDFKSSGGHFAINGEQHGFKNPKGPHLGDLPNMTVEANGTGKLKYLNTLVTLQDGPSSLKKPGGTALVIHAGPDDEMSNPSGNSGGRVACAVLAK